MSDATNNGSAAAGSPDDLIGAGPATGDGGAGQPGKNDSVDLSNYVPAGQYEELEKKLGSQGKELGDLRGFMNEISPLLDKLQGSPELVEAIMEGKIDSNLVQAIVEGKIDPKTATTVAQAHDEVKKDLGKRGYDKASPTEIEALVNEKVEEQVKKIQASLEAKLQKTEEKITTTETRRQFEQSVDQFIANTPDFKDFADEIAKWFEEHPSQFDIEIAYHAVKGRKLSAAVAADQDRLAVEAAKQVAANLAGGQSMATAIKDDNVVDQLIGRNSNPNIS